MTVMSLFRSRTSNKDCSMLRGAISDLSSRAGSSSSPPEDDESLPDVSTKSLSGLWLRYARHSASRSKKVEKGFSLLLELGP